MFSGVIHYKLEMPVINLRQKFSGIKVAARAEMETGGADSRELVGKHKKFTIESIEEAISKFRQWRPFLESIREDVAYFVRHIQINRFHWSSRIGAPDAAATGMLAGLAWTLMGGITTCVYRQAAPEWDRPVLAVEPDFRKQGLSTSLDCIFKIRVGNIMVTGIKILIKLVKRRGVNKFGRASHRRSNENCHGEYQGNG